MTSEGNEIMPIPDRRKTPHRSGFTLVELLAALALMVVLVSLAGRVTVQVLASEKHIRQLLEDDKAETRAADWMCRDWRGRLPDWMGELRQDAAGRDVLELHCVAPFLVTDDLARTDRISRLPAIVRYRLGWSEDGMGVLLREAKALVAPNPTQRMVMAGGIVDWELEYYDGDQWTSVKAGGSIDLARTQGIRVTVRMVSRNESASWVLSNAVPKDRK